MKTSKHQAIARDARERIKELQCLYAMAQVAGQPGLTLDDVLQRVADLLPAAWQFPELAGVRILFDGRSVGSGAPLGPDTTPQTAAIIVQGMNRGTIAVGYSPSIPATPLLDEEQRLLDEVARQIALIVERTEARQAHNTLQEQLRHADRLATIGQLASGVAHELNEPLGSILGFAQLLAKRPRMPRDARNDLARIEAAALHARDIIRKLMVFARQSPPCYGTVNLNRLIEESAGLWMWRCEDGSITVRYDLDPSLPSLVADEGQLRQVVTNLVVNAVQAMPEGGVLTISTAHQRDHVELSVTDTGIGIAPEWLPHIFDPFFTTKDVDQGTGLGLSVVHGIIAAHGGKTRVDSRVGRGTRLSAYLPIRRDPAVDQVPETDHAQERTDSRR